MKIIEITNYIESLAPPALQESYDNAGLIVGDSRNEVSGVLISLDVTEDVVAEAIERKANLIIAHHPIIFGGLKRLTGRNYVERTVILAIKNDIAIYAAHTNLDNVFGGVNTKICEKLNLQDCKILKPIKNRLKKIVCYVPQEFAEAVREAMFTAGAGHIGNYDKCSFTTDGLGSFRAGEGANPFVGTKNELHFEAEMRIETLVPDYNLSAVIRAIKKAHPYEEPAYDVFTTELPDTSIGAGMVGKLPKEMSEYDFLHLTKKIFKTETLKHTAFLNRNIQTVALCGGSGSFLLRDAMAAGADVFISGDFKYHEYFDAENRILIADVGHYETEQFTKELFYEILTKKFNTFACYLSQLNTNPIKYL